VERNRQIVTKELPSEVIWQELHAVLAAFESRGYKEAEILFGWAWGNHVYPTKDWEYFRLPLPEIELRIKQEEANQNGKLGSDDLYLRQSDLPFEVQFCHESDIHIWFESPFPLIDVLTSDWKAKGYAPRELVKQNEKWTERQARVVCWCGRK